MVCCQGVKGYLSSQSTLGLLNGHSFQIGATTTASAAATPETTIKYLSRDGKAWHTRGTYAVADELARIAPQLTSHASTNCVEHN